MVAVTPVGCGGVVWRIDGALRATVVVKATFGLVPDGDARLLSPAPVLSRDKHRGRRTSNSLERAKETAPFIPGTSVTLVGHAKAPAGRRVPELTVRLGVFRHGRWLLDKSLLVRGDRAHDAEAPRPFRTMPLVYERAFGGSELPNNPVGVGARADGRPPPNLIDPRGSLQGVGFGPVAKHWPCREVLLAGLDRRSLYPPIAVIPRGFEWRYFHVAPHDQQLPFLAGDEWLVLEGVHPRHPRIQTRLPSAVAHAYVVRGVDARAEPVGLRLDTIHIDADNLRASVLWRGHFAAARAAELSDVVVFAGVEILGQPIVWPFANAGSSPPILPGPRIDEARAPPTSRGEEAPSVAPFARTAPYGSKVPAPPELRGVQPSLEDEATTTVIDERSP